MSASNDFHHYKGQTLSRSEKVERQIVQMLLVNELPDSDRESSVVWELKHSAGCVQVGRILAQKRNLNVEIAETACVLHDIYVIVEGKYADHAKKGAVLARQLLKENGGFADNEVDLIVSAVEQHSDKQVYSDNLYVELVKDVDVFDCSLYKNSGNYYRIHKPADIVAHYEKRIKKVRAELGLPAEPVFRD
ncbi:HD domain-containing protein [Candidatus Kaiserbacteria bacterium]|nr:HD domain-containing protein [Candidatus Kaiserbacteria bacterium]